MRKFLSVLLVLGVGVAVGWLLRSQMTADQLLSLVRGEQPAAEPAPEPPAVSGLRDELEQAQIEVGRLRTRIAADAARVAEAAGSGRTFPVAADGTESPLRVVGDTGDRARGTLRAFVTGRSGAPMAGIGVKLTRFVGSGGSVTSTELRAETGPSGWATFPDLPPDRYTVAASFPIGTGGVGAAEGYVYRSTQAQVIPGRVAEVSLPRAAAGTVVAGRVIDRAGGTYAGALVTLIRRETFFHDTFYGRSDELGRYRIEEVPAGRYEVRARGEEVPDSPDPDAILAVSGEGTLPLDVVPGGPDAAVPLTGTVREAGSGAPIEGVRIASMSGAYAETVTDAEGRYRLIGLSAGSHRLSASKDGYAFRWLRGVALEGDGDVLDVELHPAAVLHLVVTDRDGAPAPGRLELGFAPRTEGGERLGTTVMTDGEGRAVFRQAPPGDYGILFTIDGVGSATVEATLTTGDQTLEISLR